MWGLCVGSDFKEYLNRFADYACKRALAVPCEPSFEDGEAVGTFVSVMTAAYWIRDNYPVSRDDVEDEISRHKRENFASKGFMSESKIRVILSYHDALRVLFEEQEEFLAQVRSDDVLRELKDALYDHELGVLGYTELIQRAIDEITRLRGLDAN